MRDSRFKKALFILLCLNLFSVTASTNLAAADAPRASKSQVDAFRNAKRFFDKGIDKRAVTELQDFLDRFPESPMAADAYYMIGQSYIRLDRLNDSVDFLRAVVDRYPDAPVADRAGRQLAEVLLRIGRAVEAIPLLEREAALAKDMRERRDLYAKIADLHLSNGNGLKAIESLLRRRQLLTDAAQRAEAEEKIRGVVQQYLDDSQLMQLAQLYPKSFPGGAALMRLSLSSLSRGDLFRAEGYLNQFLTDFPGHAQTEKAQEMLTKILEIHRSFDFNIGVLLPLTGKQAPYAESVMKGIQLAMDQASDMFPGHHVGLILRDYEGNAEKLKKSMDELIHEYESIAVVGPLLSRDVEWVAPVAEYYEVPLITPTASRRDIAAGNRYVFRNTVSHELIGRTLTEYAILSSGLRRFVVFYPKDPYGMEMMKIVSEEVNRLGGEIIVAQSYDEDANDFGKEIRQVVRLDLARYGAMIPPSEPGEGAEPEYVPGFDAIFLLGDPFKTGLLAAQLAFYNIRDRVLLVPDAGNSKNFLAAGDRYVEGAIGVDSFFEGSTDPIVKTFVSLYQARYKEPPDLFAAQAYDCIQLILLALKSGALLRDEVRDYIAQVRGFHGASGVTTVNQAGQVEKQLHVIQVRNGKFVQVN